ncbi:creatininase family protein [Paenibacillus aurantius]|uniref:Creatininase family protein n=1 Tax=Paenibacillus aurantius TaxID=2918900 RepID=A0AA96RH14_9BACL|nr:creatininase family protein [Paenibacillus aurantius]WNQ13061.1 creatininase family protein [Paenibacillus aurantius]
MKQWLYQDHTREEISEKAANGWMAVVPLAATEQHGPHLPVFTDSIICGHLAQEAVRQAADSIPVLLCPMLPIGCSQHHLSFGGTLSFSSATYLSILRDMGESLVSNGFRKIVFLNGHGGNDPIMHQTANDLAVKHPIWTASASYWSVSREALQERNAGEVGMVPGHAGGFETAAILALREELVRTERITGSHTERPWINSGPPGAFIGRHGELTGADGFTDAPHKATAEKGKLYLEAISGSVADWLVQVYRSMEQGENSL